MTYPQRQVTAEVLSLEALQSPLKPCILRTPVACLMNLRKRINDAASSALIPYLEEQYQTGYAIFSPIFMANAAGFVFGATFVHALQARLGRAKYYVLGESFLIAAYTTLICRPPFPAIIIAFFLADFRKSVNLALNNVFCANFYSKDNGACPTALFIQSMSKGCFL